MTWIWPLNAKPLMPGKRGSFGAVRTYDVHTGIDLYCELGTEVFAVEDGEVISIENFTGPNADDPSPWWNDTKAILVRGASGVVLYGEVEPWVKVGDQVKQGQLIASVEKSVIKKFKGRPMVMLHFELMKPEATISQWWKLGEPQPEVLLDPTNQLFRAASNYLSTIRKYLSGTEDRLLSLLEEAREVINDYAPGFTVLLGDIDSVLSSHNCVEVFSLETYDGMKFRNPDLDFKVDAQVKYIGPDDPEIDKDAIGTVMGFEYSDGRLERYIVVKWDNGYYEISHDEDDLELI